MKRVGGQIAALGRRHCTVLLQGESGTGKELVARLIHLESNRSGKPFVPVDCTALRDTLFESQLFGHNRGAFTGADRSTVGFFRAAEGGTLFLDEIGELPLPSQAKLLRSIQEGVVVPLGAVSGVSVNVRVIVATHRDLSTMVQRGEFRQDLYYRLNVACLRLPALRDRRDDIPSLVQRALDELAAVYEETPRTISDAALHALLAHDWPGNVRELMNAIEHALVFSDADAAIDLQDLPDEVRAASRHKSHDGFQDANEYSNPHDLVTLATSERNLIAAALKLLHGNQSRVAQVLDVERHRLHRRIVHHGLTGLVNNRR